MVRWQCRHAECGWHGPWYKCPWDGLDLCCPRCRSICDPVLEDGESAVVFDRACVMWSGVLLMLMLVLATFGRVWGESRADLAMVLMFVVGVVGWIGWGLFVYKKERKG